MQVVYQTAEMATLAGAERRSGRTLGCVPTMGALHAGHFSLIERSVRECDATAVSIFVNPLQFGPGEDLERYPRTLDADLAACAARGVTWAFCPDAEAMHGPDPLTRIHVNQLTERLCGLARPGHFDGVCTVVCKLLHIMQPARAYFGEKDFQQLAVVRQMTRDLFIPVEIVGCPTVREADGLAMSSRNTYLAEASRRQAPGIFRALQAAAARVAAGDRDAAAIEGATRSALLAAGADRVEYATVVNANTLAPVEVIGDEARLCVAVIYGATRLIDNIALVDAAAGAG